MPTRKLTFCLAIALAALSVADVTANLVDYCIQVAHPVNIRSTHSLEDSQIWDMLPAGTTFRVTYEGIYGNWLQVDYLTGSAWIARWLDHSPVNCPGDESPPTPTPPDSPQPLTNGIVDNMCQISWTCETELDWRRGWHAYRATQQPPTAGIPQPQPPPRPPTNPPALPPPSPPGQLRLNSGAYPLPAGCQESQLLESPAFTVFDIVCESPQQITDPLNLSALPCAASVTSRSSWYSDAHSLWHTNTSYRCDHL